MHTCENDEREGVDFFVIHIYNRLIQRVWLSKRHCYTMASSQAETVSSKCGTACCSMTTDATRAPLTTDATHAPLTIRRRVCLSFCWSIFGILFFYIVMVMFSSLSGTPTLERMIRKGWPRVATRQTGATTAPIFSIFLMSKPSSLSSLFWIIMTCSSHFAHFVILTSDVAALTDSEIIVQMFRTENCHPVFRRLPLSFAAVSGCIGIICMLFIATERCYGPALRNRQPQLPALSKLASAYIWLIFNIWFFDRLIWTLSLDTPSRNDIAYPIIFIATLLLAALISLRHHSPTPQTAEQKAKKDR